MNLLDFAQSFNKAADYCASQEHCISDVTLKLKSWGISKDFFDKIVKKLIKEGFIDEKRYALAFASGKFRMIGWGRIKIAAGLRMKYIPSHLINEAMASIDQEEYTTYLEDILHKKIIHSGGNTIENQQKALRYAASRGFEPVLIMQFLKSN